MNKRYMMALTAVSVVALSVVTAFAADAYTPIISVSGIDLLSGLNEIKALIPALLPTVVGFLAFRKGWEFLQSAIRGA